MPKHGIRLDLEFVAIAASAAIISVFMTGDIISNVMFTGLLAVLFFLIGIHLDLKELKKCTHYRKEILVGGAMIYLLTPLLAFLAAYFVPGSLGNAFIAIGVSAAAIGSPVVFSNIGKGEGDLALVIGALSLLAGFLIIPLLLLSFNVDFPILEFAVENLIFIGLPLLIGIGSQKYQNSILDDFKHHFSKLAVWLLILIMAIQFQLVYQSHGLQFITSLGAGIVLMAGFILVSYILSYIISKRAGIMERNARTIGFVAGSKAIAIALFIAAQFGGEAVAYVSAYYFVRQAVIGGIAEYFHHGKIEVLEKLQNTLLNR
jgi:BASS family bile acid:Na+ symporter